MVRTAAVRTAASVSPRTKNNIDIHVGAAPVLRCSQRRRRRRRYPLLHLHLTLDEAVEIYRTQIKQDLLNTMGLALGMKVIVTRDVETNLDSMGREV